MTDGKFVATFLSCVILIGKHRLVDFISLLSLVANPKEILRKPAKQGGSHERPE